MKELKTVIVIASALAFSLALGLLALHYVAVSEQFFRMLLM